jgi:hypothetical protein
MNDMSTIEKWAERVYGETDFGRSVATSLSGVLGLVIYLYAKDWVIAAFVSVICFPLLRLAATAIHTRVARGSASRARKSDAEHIYKCLSDEERLVISEFVKAGGCVLTWHQTNNSPMSSAAIESLMQRDLLSTSVTADGMRETFVLDPALFDVGVSHTRTQSIVQLAG